MAVVKKANAENGRHYISCTDCHKKAKTIGYTFWCESCKKELDLKRLEYITYKIYIVETYAFAKNFRYRLELHVKDESGSTIFVVFDKEAEKNCSYSCYTSLYHRNKGIIFIAS